MEQDRKCSPYKWTYTMPDGVVGTTFTASVVQFIAREIDDPRAMNCAVDAINLVPTIFVMSTLVNHYIVRNSRFRILPVAFLGNGSSRN